jgi:FSR family fosmidomycin resistance protein-like MFS transporter
MSSPAPALALDRAEPSRPVVPAFLLFSCAHFLIDMYSMALGVLQPLLLAPFGLNLTQAAASYITSFYLLAGALGGFTGGNLADRFGGRRVILFSMLCSVPFLLLFVFTPGPLSVAGLIVGGAILLFTIPVNVMMGQALAPENGGTVSALMMGAAWGVAGIFFIPLTGWVSDHYSLQHAFAGLVVVPVAGYLLALKLPK